MDFELIKDEEDPVSMGGSFFREARARSQEMADRDPVVGDIVHYWDGESCVAAIVTRDDLDSVSLTLFYPGDAPRCAGLIPHSEGKIHETWHWPCGGQ